MNANTSYATPHAWNRIGHLSWSILLAGGLAIAATDLIYCVLFWSPQGVSPMRLLQGIAAGALGRASFHGGVTTALLGAFFQWLIGFGFVLAYALVARHVSLLRQYPRRYGIAYGMLLYLVMSNLVVPLSAAPKPAHPHITWMLANIPMFAVFGTLAALFACRALRNR
ncbi:hypothetical protein [Lysobacter tyrosinilyticus]